MPVSREVYSVKVQMILACIPVIDLWAAYRIEKLRVWVLLYVGMFFVGFMIGSTGEDIAVTVIGYVISFGAALFLMRYLTMEWNRKINNDTVV